MHYRNRSHAGGILAEQVAAHEPSQPVVLALPRGGVPVGHEVALRLGCPFDVLVARKLGVPWHGELGMGAIAEGGVVVINDELVARLRITEAEVEAVRAAEETELQRRASVYRGGRPRLPLTDSIAIIVDDGLATGYTAAAAIDSVRRAGAAQAWLAVPVGPKDTVDWLKQLADRVICSLTPRFFEAVGMWYDDFTQTTDDEVVVLLGS